MKLFKIFYLKIIFSNSFIVTKVKMLYIHLHGKQDDCDQSKPGVEAVQVRDRLGFCVVVRVKHGLQGDGGKEEGGDHDNGVCVLQPFLALIPENTVQKNS